VEEAVDCTGLSSDDARLLLRLHCWDLAACNEAFFEDSEYQCGRAGIPTALDVDGAPNLTTAQDMLCGICFTDPGVAVMPCESRPLRRNKDKAKGVAETHPKYCRDCWQQYLGHGVEEGKSCLDLRCPTPGCGEALRTQHFVDLLGQGPLLERYLRFLAESLVDDSKGRFRWCPGQSCGRAAREPGSESRQVNCPCGVIWCFGCATDSHLPVSCEFVRRWEEKNYDAGQDATWIRVHTKVCPKCTNPIEKNGGCMHMTCRKPGGCGHEFCWICMQDWKTHSKCNAEPENVEKLNKMAQEKSELFRYAHFFERYLEHEKAQKYAASEQKSQIETVGSLLSVRLDLKVSDVTFLSAAVKQIEDSRRFLKWTYPYAFFASFKSSEKELFEFHQAQLEQQLEKLSDIMENTNWDSYVETDDGQSQPSVPFGELRGQVINLTEVLKNFFTHLQDAIQKGTLFTGDV